MIASLLYILGLSLRSLALLIIVKLAIDHRSWRYTLLALGISWIVIQPILQFFFGDTSYYVTAMPVPEVFLLTSVIALILVYQFYVVLRANAEYKAHEDNSTKQNSRRQEILLALAKRRGQNLKVGLTDIVQASATELNLQRVGIWLYNQDRTGIVSVKTYDHGKISEEPIEILQAEFPEYFKALDRTGMIIANNARSHRATRGLMDYMVLHNVHSMLDVPIWVDGELVGIICHEQTVKLRDWSKEDQDFAHSLADLCALLIVADRRLQVEQELRESQRNLQDAQDAGQFASFRWIPEKHEITCSGEVVNLLGLQVGTQPDNISDTLAMLVEQDAEKLVEVLTHAYETHESFRLMVQTKPEFGDRHFEVRARYGKDSDTDIDHFEGTAQDITERVKIEKENKRLEGQLIQSQKMESIGTMAGGIAHDFNNLLTPILGYTDIALAELKDSDPLKGPLKEILNSSLKAKDLVEQILLFSRRFEETREAVDVAEIIHSALRLMRPTLPSSVNIIVDIDPQHKPVQADPTQLVQVVVNLCTNAWHAMRPNGGTLTINLYPGNEAPHPTTCLRIKDTGVGISESAQERIFEPFYTTKDVGEGTGLGLSMVHGIVSKLGGKIEVHSQLGEGSEFLIYLPATDQEVFTPIQGEIRSDSNSASILVVDDDKAVAGTLESMLTDLGYRTEVHISSESALTIFSKTPKEFDLIVTDLTMPSMSGVELCRKIRQIEPNIPLVILSGYPRDMVSEQLAEFSHCHILAKPLVRADLAAAMAEELH